MKQNDINVEWHLEHKKMGFCDPVAELFEAITKLSEEKDDVDEEE